MTQSLNFWSFSGRIGRGAYAVVGFVAFAVKHNVDRLLAQSQNVPWSPWNYWIPFGEMFGGVPSGSKEQELAKTLFFVALPFLWIAFTFTAKRLRDAGQPPWLAILMLVPVVNLLFFAVLCVLPSRTFYGRNVRNEPIRVENEGFWPQSQVGSAGLGGVFAAVLGIVVTWMDLKLLGRYGLALFVALPFVMGYAAVWIDCHRRSRKPEEVIAVVTWTVALAAMGICAIAIDYGAILFRQAFRARWWPSRPIVPGGDCRSARISAVSSGVCEPSNRPVYACHPRAMTNQIARELFNAGPTGLKGGSLWWGTFCSPHFLSDWHLIMLAWLCGTCRL